jgi:N-acetylglucosamine-6-phosphate deacetylase
MTRRILAARRVFTGETFLPDHAVVIENGRVADLLPAAGLDAAWLAEDEILAPGYIDLQVNGGGGVLLNDAVTPAAMQAIAAAHRGLGTTAILPTLISGSRAQLRAALQAASQAIEDGAAGIVGLHLEGPFLNVARRGIHPAASMLAMTQDDVDLLTAPFPGRLLVTLAPECVPAEYISQLAQAGVLVFAGHTDATAEQMQAGFDAGITGVTHLFNAMSQFGSRTPGAVGAALAADCHAGIIADGLHVHPTALAAALAAKGPDRLFLVSDAMSTIGSTLDRFSFGGQTIYRQGDRLAAADGTLAGAHLSMAQAVRRIATLPGRGAAEALRMATATPADCLGLRIGRIAAGCSPGMIVLGPDLVVRRVIQ